MIRPCAAILWIALAGCSRPAETLTVSLAASLQGAMKEIASQYEWKNPRVRLVLNFGASGMLAQQIEQGAPADVFLSAAPQPMDTLAARGLILPGTRRDLLRNRIVLITPLDSRPRTFRELPAVKL